eukprot:TRINITY_DN9077_c1_g2_i1.p1 TRINITY_DN9077_c1_g2~~TRINITY_DN9077_c1_g2_i1.p1  ORF type:complete len:690 (+),score=86.90 TRINITY_DN9077_c1_g2_i1:57-2126(+)
MSRPSPFLQVERFQYDEEVVQSWDQRKNLQLAPYGGRFSFLPAEGIFLGDDVLDRFSQRELLEAHRELICEQDTCVVRDKSSSSSKNIKSSTNSKFSQETTKIIDVDEEIHIHPNKIHPVLQALFHDALIANPPDWFRDDIITSSKRSKNGLSSVTSSTLTEDAERFRRGQDLWFKKHWFRSSIAGQMGLFAGFAIARFAEVLLKSGYARNSFVAGTRYADTGFIISDWFRLRKKPFDHTADTCCSSCSSSSSSRSTMTCSSRSSGAGDPTTSSEQGPAEQLLEVEPLVHQDVEPGNEKITPVVQHEHHLTKDQTDCPFLRSVFHVRIMHALARKASRSVFDYDREGVPLSQADMLEVLLGFTGVPFFIIEREFGGYGCIGEDEKRDMVYAWRVIAFYLGIRDRYNICESVETMDEFFEQHFMRFTLRRFETCRIETAAKLRQTAIEGLGWQTGLGTTLFKAFFEVGMFYSCHFDFSPYVEKNLLPARSFSQDFQSLRDVLSSLCGGKELLLSREAKLGGGTAVVVGVTGAAAVAVAGGGGGAAAGVVAVAVVGVAGAVGRSLFSNSEPKEGESTLSTSRTCLKGFVESNFLIHFVALMILRFVLGNDDMNRSWLLRNMYGVIRKMRALGGRVDQFRIWCNFVTAVFVDVVLWRLVLIFLNFAVPRRMISGKMSGKRHAGKIALCPFST